MEILQPGQMLGPYRIMNQVGQGGMATVYRAFQASMNRYVALKVLPKQLAESPEFTGRFQQEARIIANLEHPHILPVYDFGESDGISYLVMRYLDAGTLKDRMTQRPIPLPVIDRWFSQLADALEYAHGHGVVHRDLKPSNVLLDPRDNLFLTDFGIAKLLESSSKFTSTGAMIGTPDYMSPEQAQGLPVDQRSDIYSLGIILYEMVTGRVPFEAETPLAVILKHIGAPLPLPSSIKPGISPAIEQVLLKALAKDPDDRFSSVEEFQTAWKQALEGKAALLKGTVPPLDSGRDRTAVDAKTPAAEALSTPLPAAPTLVEPAVTGKKKMPGWAAAGVVLGVLLLIFFVFVSVGPTIRERISSHRANRQANPPATQVSAATQISPKNEPQQPAQNPPEGPSKWTSWVAANHPWLVLVDQDRVIGGGVGLSIWRKDGTLLERFNGPADHRLPDVFVTALLMDSSRVLWVGTGDGIARYDGTQWQIFNMDDGLDSNSIGALALGKDGIIVGTQYCAIDGCGLGLLTKNGYDPVKGFPSIEGAEGPGKLSNAVTALLSKDNTLWVGTLNGLAQFDGQTWKTYFVPDGLPGESINSIYADPQGTIWVATSNGAATFTGQHFQPVDRLKDAAVRDIQQDKDGRYWFSMDGGISKFDPASGDWQRYTQDDALPASTFYAIDIDQDGVLYFGSDGGLIRGDAKGFSTWRLPNVPEFPGFSRILPSNEPGKLWMISPDSGGHPDTLDVRSEAWSVENRLPDGCVPMAAGLDGTIWCGGESGLWVIPPDRVFSHYGKFDGLRSDLVDKLVLLPGGSAWVGTRDQGVAGFDGKGFTQILNQQASGLSSNEITALLPATDGSLWVGTPVGLDRRLPVGKWEHYRAGQPFGPQAGGVTDIAEDAAGAVWVSTSGESGVVYRYTQGKWTRISAEDPSVGLPNDEVKCITAAPDGSLWFGLYYHGAVRFDGRSWQQFQVRDGLVFPDVNDIFVDTAGTVWFATTGGVARYIP